MTALAEPRRAGQDIALAVGSLSRTFGGQRALDDVDLVLGAGEIHALLGQNGSGKSTLIKVLAGLHQPDPGASITAGAHQLVHAMPRQSHAAGLRFIHQDLGLVPGLRVLDNLELTSRSPRLWLSERRLRRRAQDLLGAYGLDVDVTAPTSELTLAQQSMLAITRAVHDLPEGRGVLVLDEPTASLPPAEVARLLDLLTSLRTRGLAVLYVTHRLAEVLAVADRVTVLRDGRRVAEHPRADIDHDRLVELILGGARPEPQAARTDPTAARRPGPAADAGPGPTTGLQVEGLVGGRLHEISFDAPPGGVLGITGLVGSGYEDVLSHVFGASRTRAGEVTVFGRRLPAGRCDLAVLAGVGLVPSERDSLGSIPGWTLGENLTLPAIPVRGRSLMVDTSRERRDAHDWTHRLEIAPPDPHRPLSTFSGGNRQRVVVGRWLRSGARVLLLDEPTIGVDVAGKDRIHRLLREAAAGGAVVVVASSDHEELAALCDRVLVVRNGTVTAELEDEITVDALFVASVGPHTPAPAASTTGPERR